MSASALRLCWAAAAAITLLQPAASVIVVPQVFSDGSALNCPSERFVSPSENFVNLNQQKHIRCSRCQPQRMFCPGARGGAASHLQRASTASPAYPALSIVPHTASSARSLVVLQTNRAYGGRPFMYGTAEPGEIVTVAGLSRRSANGVPYPTTADASGRWRLQLDPYQGGATFNATITGSVSSNTIEITNIVYGDVILCSGQSNMNKPLSYVLNASAEIKAATYENIRLFTVPGAGYPNCVTTPGAHGCGPQTNWTERQCQKTRSGQPCQWLDLSPETVRSFSAVCYLTVTEMMRIQPKLRAASAEWHNQGTMFGLIQAAVDGTTLEEWSPPASLALCAKEPTLIKDRESQHYNGMIAPLVGFSLKMALCQFHHALLGPSRSVSSLTLCELLGFD